MDRNRGSSKSGLLPLVALRKESVDRNVEDYLHAGGLDVALRKESVDRNAHKNNRPSVGSVALRKESVDRNAVRPYDAPMRRCRSPQGERG